MLKNLFLIIIFISCSQVNGVELKQIAIINKPANISEREFNNAYFKFVSKKIWNGNIIINCYFSSSYSKYAFIIHPSGITAEIIPEKITGEETTELIGTLVENNVLKVITERRSIRIISTDTGDLQLKTLNPTGYQSVKNQSISTTITKFKQSADKLEPIDEKQFESSRFLLSNHKLNGEIISQKIFDGKYSPSIIPDFPEPDDNGYSLQIKDGFIYVFKMLDLNNQGNSSGLSIKITGSKSSSIIGTIQSSNSKDVRVQSSENIIDWIDIEKITNPNGKEIVIPFSKNKEFIRIIE
jgi:hypothetical protein